MKAVLTSALNGKADLSKPSTNHTDTSLTAPSHQFRVLTDDEMDMVAGGAADSRRITNQIGFNNAIADATNTRSSSA